MKENRRGISLELKPKYILKEIWVFKKSSMWGVFVGFFFVSIMIINHNLTFHFVIYSIWVDVVFQLFLLLPLLYRIPISMCISTWFSFINFFLFSLCVCFQCLYINANQTLQNKKAQEKMVDSLIKCLLLLFIKCNSICIT